MLSASSSGGLVGFGVDYNYTDRYAKGPTGPRGLEGLLELYRDRLSHVSIVAIPTVEEARAIRGLVGSRPLIHHLSDISPASAEGPDMNRFEVQDAISRELDAAWCGEDIGLWRIGPYGLPYFAPPILDEDVADHVGAGIRQIADRTSVPFLAEVPSCSFVAGAMTLGAFFHRLVDKAGCEIVLDVSHVYSYALAVGRPSSEVLASLPLESVCEVHVAGGKVNATHSFRYIDTHSDPVMTGVLDVLSEAVGLCPNLRAVTYELGVGLTADTLDADFDRVESILRSATFKPRLRPS